MYRKTSVKVEKFSEYFQELGKQVLRKSFKDQVLENMFFRKNQIQDNQKSKNHPNASHELVFSSDINQFVKRFTP